tara:strand:- start:52 stop:327 length:276 start_codon:yes stop_codon:yes gene_type:complete
MLIAQARVVERTTQQPKVVALLSRAAQLRAEVLVVPPAASEPLQVRPTVLHHRCDPRADAPVRAAAARADGAAVAPFLAAREGVQQDGAAG